MLRRASCCLSLSWLCTLSTAADIAATPYAQIQATRSAVAALIKNDATPDQLREGAARLEESLRILDQADVHALAVGNPSLYFRGHDVCIDLARLYARLGQTERALDTLEAAQRYVWLPEVASKLAGDPAFAGLRATPRDALAGRRQRAYLHQAGFDPGRT